MRAAAGVLLVSVAGLGRVGEDGLSPSPTPFAASHMRTTRWPGCSVGGKFSDGPDGHDTIWILPFFLRGRARNRARLLCSLGVAMGSPETMLRRISMRLSLLLLIASFVPVSSAAADACTCVDLEFDAPVSEATSGDDAVSQPVDAIASFVTYVPPPPEPEKVLWCEGSDDPRCFPVQGHSAGFDLSVPSPGDLARDVAPRSRALSAQNRTAFSGFGPSAGVRLRLDRPPQA